MPTSHNVYPGGGGDYTTIQAWETAVDGTALDQKTARCDDSGNLGTLDFRFWTNSPDASNQAFIINDAAGDLHDADESTLTSAAHTNGTASTIVWLIDEPYLTVNGIVIIKSNTNTSFPALEWRSGSDNCTLKNSFVRQAAAANQACMDVDSGVTSFLAENTVFQADAGATSLTNILQHAATGGTYTNCTFHNNGTGSTVRGVGGGGSATLNSCSAMNFTDTWYTGTWSGDYNIQDTNESDMPGYASNSTSNATIPTAFGSGDFKLVSGDAHISAGHPSSSTATDFQGTSRSSPDCGVHEFVAAGGGTEFPFYRYYGQGGTL